MEGFKQYVNKNQRCFGNPIKDIITLDGMRVVFDGGFALIRQSNTEPVFTLRFEGKTEKEIEIDKRLIKIKELKQKKYTNKEIAEMLGITERTVINELKK